MDTKKGAKVAGEVYDKCRTELETNPVTKWYVGVVITFTFTLLFMGMSPAIIMGLGVVAGYRIHGINNNRR